MYSRKKDYWIDNFRFVFSEYHYQFSSFFGMKTKGKGREIFVRIEKKRSFIKLLGRGTRNLAVRVHRRIKEASISLCERVETVIAVVIPNILPGRSLFLHSRLQGKEEWVSRGSGSRVSLFWYRYTPSVIKQVCAYWQFSSLRNFEMHYWKVFR